MLHFLQTQQNTTQHNKKIYLNPKCFQAAGVPLVG